MREKSPQERISIVCDAVLWEEGIRKYGLRDNLSGTLVAPCIYDSIRREQSDSRNFFYLVDLSKPGWISLADSLGRVTVSNLTETVDKGCGLIVGRGRLYGFAGNYGNLILPIEYAAVGGVSKRERRAILLDSLLPVRLTSSDTAWTLLPLQIETD